MAARRWATRMMSRMTAPLDEVTTPMRRGQNGRRRLRSGANSPSAASLRFSSSKASISRPAPAGSSAVTDIWNLPRPS
jgi:hypothetical protein